MTYANILRYGNVYAVHSADEADDLIATTEEYVGKETCRVK